MESVQTVDRPSSEPLTYVDLETMPDDGRRHELIDGVLIVTPSPSWNHQRCVRGLFRALDPGCPDGLEVLFAPMDVRLADDTVLEPDLLVVRVEEMTQHGLIGRPPLLAVEVVSPGTRSIDLHHKFERLERAGCPSYWVVDPEAASLTAWELREERYVKITHVTGEESFETAKPYGVTIVPAQLLT